MFNQTVKNFSKALLDNSSLSKPLEVSKKAPKDPSELFKRSTRSDREF
jgi:hypothetical protein